MRTFSFVTNRLRRNHRGSIGICGAAMAAAIIAAAPSSADAATTIVLDPGTTNETSAITTNLTTGDQMAGMVVTAFFHDATSETAVWAAVPLSNIGQAVGTGWSLSADQDTFSTGPLSRWTLTNLSGKGIVQLLIDGGPGNTVFDTAFGGLSGTANSTLGRNFTPQLGLSLSTIVATYRDAVALTGFPPVGDLFRRLDIQVSNPGGLTTGGTYVFLADTDNSAGAIAPPASNDPPVCTADLTEAQEDFIEPTPGTFIVTEGQTITVPFTGTDANGDTLTAALAGLPASATLAPLSGSAPLVSTLTWTPTAADTAGSPYTADVTFTDPSGDFSTCTLGIVVNLKPTASCSAQASDSSGTPGHDITVECDDMSGRAITLSAVGSSDPDDATLIYLWDVSDLSVVLDDVNAATTTGVFPIGVTMATLTVTDGRGGMDTCDVVVRVQDTTPPEVMCMTNIASLQPPKHQMRPVMVVVTATDDCGLPGMVIPIVVTVRSDEPDDAQGPHDGNTTGDVNGQDGFTAPVNVSSLFTPGLITGTWTATIMLRAERDKDADGRKYTIDVAATDSQGNVATTSAVVVVPHDKKPHPPPPAPHGAGGHH